MTTLRAPATTNARTPSSSVQAGVGRASAARVREVLRGQTAPTTVADITRLLGLPDSARDTVSSLLCSDVKRGRVGKVEVMRVRNLPVHGYTWLADPMPRRDASAASRGLESRRRDRANAIRMRRALWDALRTGSNLRLTAPELAKAAKLEMSQASWVMSCMIKSDQIKRLAIPGTHAHSKGPRWFYYIDETCSEPPKAPDNGGAAQQKLRGPSFEGLMAAWSTSPAVDAQVPPPPPARYVDLLGPDRG